MSEWYVSSISGDNGNDGYGPTDRTDPSQADNWTNAFENLVTAFVSAGDNDIIYTASGHDYGNSSGSYTGGGTIGSPVLVISVNTTTGAYLVGAKETFTNVFNPNATSKEVHYLGVSLESTNYITLNASGIVLMIDGNIKCTTSNRHILLSEGATLLLQNLGVEGNNNAKLFLLQGASFVEINNCVLSGTPPVVFAEMIYRGGRLNIKNSNLSIFSGAGIYWINGPDISSEEGGPATITRCKIGSTPPGLTPADIINPTAYVKLLSCDNGDDTTFFQEKYHTGEIFKDTANYLTSDHSAKMVTNAYSREFTKPLRYMLLSQPLAANPTIKVNTMTDGVTLQNDEFWIEVEAPDETDEALGIVISSRTTDIRTTPSNLDTNSESWTDDISTPVKQETEVTVTGGAAGIHTVYACFAKPSSTVYVERDATIS